MHLVEGLHPCFLTIDIRNLTQRRQYDDRNTSLDMTKAHRAAVSVIVKGCNMAWVLLLMCFLSLLPNYIHIYAITIYHFHICRITSTTQYIPLLTSGGWQKAMIIPLLSAICPWSTNFNQSVDRHIMTLYFSHCDVS